MVAADVGDWMVFSGDGAVGLHGGAGFGIVVLCCVVFLCCVGGIGGGVGGGVGVGVVVEDEHVFSR